jgi:protein gp37
MAEASSIEWTHHTFNPWRGCAKVHAGCTHCYAEKNVGVAMSRIGWGEVWQGGQRVVKAESGWSEPLSWARAAARAGERRRVFCASLADVLEQPQRPRSWPSHMTQRAIVLAEHQVERAQEDLDHAREKLWDLIRDTHSLCRSCLFPTNPRGRDGKLRGALGGGCMGHLACRLAGAGGLDWLLLSKRPENWRLVPEDVRPLVWLGTSVSDQKTADEWVPRLLQAEGVRLRFLSVEPLVGPVDLRAFLPALIGGYRVHKPEHFPRSIGWVIVGGESGPNARQCRVGWVRDLVLQCREAGVPCFVKQLGSAFVDEKNGVAGARLKVSSDARDLVRARLTDDKGGDPSEWPEDLRMRQFPEVSHG